MTGITRWIEREDVRLAVADTGGGGARRGPPATPQGLRPRFDADVPDSWVEVLRDFLGGMWVRAGAAAPPADPTGPAMTGRYPHPSSR